MSSRYAALDPPVPGIVWSALVAYSLVICVLHFGGLEYELYTAIWWWDLLTHSLSGIGVAAWLTTLDVVPPESNPLVVLPLLVLAIGAGFEVYEYLFKDFYVEWTLQYYLVDTVVDLAVDVLGACALAVWQHRATADEQAQSTVAPSTSS